MSGRPGIGDVSILLGFQATAFRRRRRRRYPRRRGLGGAVGIVNWSLCRQRCHRCQLRLRRRRLINRCTRRHSQQWLALSERSTSPALDLLLLGLLPPKPLLGRSALPQQSLPHQVQQCQLHRRNEHIRLARSLQQRTRCLPTLGHPPRKRRRQALFSERSIVW